MSADDSNKTGDVESPQWAQDFPIEVGRDNYVARRDFTKFMVLTSFAFVVGQLFIGLKNAVRKHRGQLPEREIAKLDQIPIGKSFSFVYPNEHDPCLLIRRGENELVAFSQKCTHLSCAVVPKPEENCLACPCHEGAFDLNTGRAIAGPPRRPLPRVTLTVRNGAVYATGLEVSTV